MNSFGESCTPTEWMNLTSKYQPMTVVVCPECHGGRAYPEGEPRPCSCKAHVMMWTGSRRLGCTKCKWVFHVPMGMSKRDLPGVFESTHGSFPATHTHTPADTSR